jgi:FkbM family methyltransferase
MSKIQRYFLLFLAFLHDRMGRQIGINSSDFNQRLLKHVLKDRQDLIVFDVGANVGNFTKKVFSSYPHAQVFAFEPQTDLETHFGIYSNKRFVFCPLALSDMPGVQGVFRRFSGDPNAKLIPSPGISPVQVSTVDDEIRRFQVERINLLKIDTEGNDFNVIKGASLALKNHKIDYILFEIVSELLMSKTYPTDVEAFLRLHGFNHFYRTTPHMGVIPLKKLHNYQLETQNILASKIDLESQ